MLSFLTCDLVELLGVYWSSFDVSCQAVLFIYLLFLAAVGLHYGVQASHCGGFSCCRTRALGTRASVVVARRLSSCGWRALERRLGSCGASASLLRGMWDLPPPGLEPLSPTLAGGFLTTAPPGKPP